MSAQQTMTVAEYVASRGKKKRGAKYGNKKVFVGDLKFDSKKEATRYTHLKLLERDGLIKPGTLRLQCVWPIFVTPGKGGEPIKVCKYISDFDYIETSTGKHVVEDVKSAFTRMNPRYRLKKKLFEAYYGVLLTEV